MCIVEVVDAVTSTLSVVAHVQSIKAQKTANEFAAQQSIKQAEIAERNAAYERQQGIEDARQRRLKSIQNMGQIKTNIAAGNILNSSATALNLIDSEEQQGELDALNIINSSEKRAESYMNSAEQRYASASLQSFKAKSNYQNSMLSLFSDSLNKGVRNF